jgi:uncharacterized membrane protein YfhO
VAVFSEIFYDKGWTATVNGQEIPIIRANYLLRALPLKAGNYEVDFKFEPQSYSLGNTIALISSLALIIGALAVIFWQIKKSKEAKA